MYAEWLEKYGSPERALVKKRIRSYVCLIGPDVAGPITRVNLWEGHAPTFLAAINRANLDAEWFPTRVDSYNLRKISGSDRWSKHAWGCAIDVFGETGPIDPKTGLHRPPMAWVKSMKRSGLTWGGDWKKPDPHHFEIPDSWPTNTSV